jgi:hypothetical protein
MEKRDVEERPSEGELSSRKTEPTKMRGDLAAPSDFPVTNYLLMESLFIDPPLTACGASLVREQKMWCDPQG